jgi:hypothetical protein
MIAQIVMIKTTVDMSGKDYRSSITSELSRVTAVLV